MPTAALLTSPHSQATPDLTARCADRDGYGIHPFVSGTGDARRILWQVHRTERPGQQAEAVGEPAGTLEEAERFAEERQAFSRRSAWQRETMAAREAAAREARMTFQEEAGVR